MSLLEVIVDSCRESMSTEDRIYCLMNNRCHRGEQVTLLDGDISYLISGVNNWYFNVSYTIYTTR